MSRVLAFEWRRAVSLRSTWGFLVLGSAVLIFVGWGAMIFNGSQEGADAGDVHVMEGVVAFDGGGPVGFVLITAICAQAFGHEYRHGTIRLVLSQFPKRTQVFLAKLAVPAAMVAVTVLTALAIAAVGAAVLWDVSPRDDWQAVASAGSRQVAVAVWWGLMVAGVTALFRNLAAGIIVSLLLSFVVEFLVIGLLTRIDPATGDSYSRAPWLTENLPFTNAINWSLGGEWGDAVVAGLWAAAVLGAAGMLFLRRDA